MKKLIILFLLLTASASAQFPMVAAWDDATWTPAKDDSATVWAIAADLSATKATGDTIGYLPNRITTGFSFGDFYQLTDALKPVYHDSTSIGKGVFLRFDGSDDQMKTQLTTAYGRPYTVFLVFAVWKRGGASANDIIRDGHSALGYVVANYNVNNAIFNGGNLTLPPLSADSVHTFMGFFNGAASTISRSPSLTNTGAAGTSVAAGGATYGSLAGGTRATYLTLYEVMETRSVNQIPNYKAYIQAKYGKAIP